MNAPKPPHSLFILIAYHKQSKQSKIGWWEGLEVKVVIHIYLIDLRNHHMYGIYDVTGQTVSYNQVQEGLLLESRALELVETSKKYI